MMNDPAGNSRPSASNVASQGPGENLRRDVVTVALYRGEKLVGIVGGKEERSILFPLTFGREEGQDRKLGLSFGRDRVPLEAPGQDEDFVPHPLQHVYPLFSFECDAVNVTDPANDDSDVH